MLVDCPDCAHSYTLGAAAIGEHGRVVICSRCDARWFQQGTRPVDTAEPAVVAPVVTRAKDPRPRARSLCVALALAAAAVLVGARTSVVRAVPRTAALYAAVGWPVNLRGLAIARLRPEPATSAQAGDTVLAGEIRNVAGRRVPLPRIAFEIRDDVGVALVTWSEALPAATLAAGRTLAFASAPRRLPPGGRTVLAHFAEGAAP